jgi:hypothetical protein
MFKYAGDSPGTQGGTQAFKDAVASCTLWAVGEILEHGSEGANEDKAPPSAAVGEQILSAKALLAARCTRNATTCGDMLGCLRGRYSLRPLPDFIPAASAQPPPDAGPPPTLPSWATPWDGRGPDPALDRGPWDGGVMMMPTDSPACTSCTLQRCPTFAYYCFGAAGNDKDCPGGDCCQGLRQCIFECGGYDPMVTIAKFDRCATRCRENRPSAAQQLADLLHCGDVACAGCENFDRTAGGSP